MVAMDVWVDCCIHSGCWTNWLIHKINQEALGRKEALGL
jgi:hypothetical protein